MRAVAAKGSDDFSGLRAHQITDSPRHVAWKAVARGAEMLTKQFAGRADARLWLDWELISPLLDVEARLSRLTGWVLEELKPEEFRQLGDKYLNDTRIYRTGFSVLRNAKMAATLLELGFINNAVDNKRMQKREFQTGVAQAVVKGLKVYLGDGK